jgi:membrane protein DedA with SNARE-associated domain
MTIVDNIITWYSAHMNYASITALMAVESSFIPFPSEVVIPPAAFVAGQPESVLCTTGNYPVDVLLIILFGTLGAMIGAIINYGLSVWLGRLIIYKFADSRLGHMCLLSSEKLQRAEEYFREKGNVSTFIGRFIPGIRQLISIPAGLARMNFGAFLWWTFLGAFIWNCVLALVGYVAAGQMDLIKEYSHELSVAILILFGLAVVYFVVKRLVKR